MNVEDTSILFPALHPKEDLSRRSITTIHSRKGWAGVNWMELWRFRYLIYFFVWRDVKLRYRQTLLGASWAIIQPLASMLMFTLCFKMIANVPSDGIPYPLFSYVSILVWTYFSKVTSSAGTCILGNKKLVSRVYFPRLILPFATIFSHLVDFMIALIIIILPILFLGSTSFFAIILGLPALTLLLLLFTFGVSCWLGTLHILFRDIGFAVGFVIQLWMYVTPVIYPLSLVPASFQKFFYLNPLCGIFEAFRNILFGRSLNYEALGYSIALSLLTLTTGVLFFLRHERKFADLT